VLLPSYSWQAYRLPGGLLVVFSCRVNDQYASAWPEDAKSKALTILSSELKERSEPNESIVVLKTGMSEGGRANVLLAVGSKSFTEEWKAKGAQAAGLKVSEHWAKNNGPSFTNKSKPNK
jgi:hypothetical protein